MFSLNTLLYISNLFQKIHIELNTVYYFFIIQSILLQSNCVANRAEDSLTFRDGCLHQIDNTDSACKKGKLFFNICPP